MNSFNRLDKKINKWVVFSEDMREFMRKQPFISGDKILVIRHGIDTNAFFEGGMKPAAPIKFLYAGRFEAIKGVAVLADAWRLLPDSPSERVLYLAGNWQASETGKQVKAALEARKDVVFIGNLSQQELANLYRQTHCVIIPSNGVETGPLVFHEAIACGCDVISSDIGGQGELVKLYPNKARPFTTGNSKALRDVIFQYAPSVNRDLYTPMSAHEHFEKLAHQLTIA